METPYPPEMPPELDAPRGGRSSNLAFLVIALVAAVALVAIAMTAFDAQVYYYTVAEAADIRDDIGETEFRLKGNVVPGSLAARDGLLNQHIFALQAEGHSATVHYDGPLPDTFADNAEVIALGRFTAAGYFEAIEVVAKCPSRYEEQPPTATTAGL